MDNAKKKKDIADKLKGEKGGRVRDNIRGEDLDETIGLTEIKTKLLDNQEFQSVEKPKHQEGEEQVK